MENPELRLQSDDSSEEFSPSKGRAKREQWVTTAVIYYCNIAMGIAGAYLAPALMSFVTKFETDMQTMSILITGAKYINLASSFAFGFILNVLNRHLVVVALISQLALVIAFMPYAGSLTIFGTFLGLLHISFGGYNTAQSVWIIELWKEKSGPFVQAQHFLYAVGCILPPTVFAPFLEHKDAPLNGTVVDHMAGVYTPSYICGIVVGAGALLMLATFVFCRNSPKSAESEALQERRNDSADAIAKVTQQEKPAFTCRRALVIFFSSLILGGTASMETAVNSFLPTYAHYSNFNFTEAEASRLFSAFQISFTAGRLTGIFIIMKISPTVILIGNLVIVAASNLLLIASSTAGSATMAYVGSVLMGIGFSTTFPTVYAYLQSRLEFTNLAASVLLVGGQAVASFTPVVVGQYIETFADIVTWLNVGTVAIMAASFLIVILALIGVKGKV